MCVFGEKYDLWKFLRFTIIFTLFNIFLEMFLIFWSVKNEKLVLREKKAFELL